MENAKESSARTTREMYYPNAMPSIHKNEVDQYWRAEASKFRMNKIEALKLAYKNLPNINLTVLTQKLEHDPDFNEEAHPYFQKQSDQMEVFNQLMNHSELTNKKVSTLKTINAVNASQDIKRIKRLYADKDESQEWFEAKNVLKFDQSIN